MLALVAIILIVGFAQGSGAKPVASSLPVPAHPLRKPEPGMLLLRSDLALSPSQVLALKPLAEDWAKEKSKLMTAMSGFEPKQGRSEQISQSLQGYSELSRTYDAVRASYWSRAYSLLNPKQRSLIEGGSK